MARDSIELGQEIDSLLERAEREAPPGYSWSVRAIRALTMQILHTEHELISAIDRFEETIQRGLSHDAP